MSNPGQSPSNGFPQKRNSVSSSSAAARQTQQQQQPQDQLGQQSQQQFQPQAQFYPQQYAQQQDPQLYQSHVYYPGQNYYQMNPQYSRPSGLYRPQDYAQSHINITNANGDKVDVAKLNATQRSPAVPPATVATGSTVSDAQKKMQEAFKAKVAAAKKAAAEKAAASSAETTAEIAPAPQQQTPQETAPETTAESKSSVQSFKESVAARAKVIQHKTEDVVEQPKVEEPKAEEPETVVEEPKVEEPKTVVEEPKTVVQEPEAVVEEPKAEVEESKVEVEEPKTVVEEPKVEVEEPKVEEPKTEEPAVEEQKASSESSETTTSSTNVTSATSATSAEHTSTEERSVTDETIAEEPSAEDATSEISAEAEGDNVTAFLERIAIATAIEDPFTFEYSTKVKAPNPEIKLAGVKRYDADFLMQFSDCTRFAVDKEFENKIDFIVKDNVNRGSSGRNRGGFRFGMGSGLSGSQGFAKSSPGLRRGQYDMNSRSNSRQGSSKRRGPSNRGDRKSNRNRDRDMEREREPEIPSEPVKPLEKSATRWIPKSRAAKQEEVIYAPDGVTVIMSKDDVTRKVNSLLNKLTLEYFDDISDNILEIANQSKWQEEAETLKLVIQLTFDKATDEPHWSEMYASLCAKLMATIDEEVKDSSSLKDGQPRSGQVLVRTLLLSKCQTEYEKGWTDKLPTNEDGTPLDPEMMTDEYYVAAAAKRRGLGLVRFIGHLFVLGLLSPPVIRSCLLKLSENVVDPSDDTIENLMQLIKTVGPKLDSEKQGAVLLSAIFEKLKLLESAKIPSRLLFALMDLQDLRKKRWAGLANSGPKTITQIHEEERQKQEEQRSHEQRKRSNKSDSRSNSSRNSGWGNSRSDIGDFRRVGQSSSSNLGPTNNFSKSRSSRRGPPPQQHQQQQQQQQSQESNFERSESSRQNSQKPQQNAFALLGGEDGEDHDAAPVTTGASEEVEAEAPAPEDN